MGATLRRTRCLGLVPEQCERPLEAGVIAACGIISQVAARIPVSAGRKRVANAVADFAVWRKVIPHLRLEELI
jgi:hypothetical protein